MGVVRGFYFASPLAAVKYPLHNTLDEKVQSLNYILGWNLDVVQTRVETRDPKGCLLALSSMVETLRCTPELAKHLVSLHSKVMWSPLPNHFRHHSRIHLDFTMLTTTRFQFSMLNIYHSYRCHLKTKPLCDRPLVYFVLSH